MALHTKKDFGLLCGLKTKDLSVYIRRGKVVLTGEYINDTDEVNAFFLQKQSEKAIKNDVLPPKIEEKTGNSNIVIAEKATKKDKTPAEKLEKLTYHQLEKESRLADIAKKEVDTRIAILKEEKLLGISIPTELVKGIISQMGKGFTSSYKDGADSFLIEINKRKNLTATETAELRGELVRIINEASIRALNETKKNMKLILSEYSESRGVGEHD